MIRWRGGHDDGGDGRELERRVAATARTSSRALEILQ